MQTTDYYTKCLAEQVQKNGFHTMRFEYTFLSGGVNAVCVLEKYAGVNTEELGQGFFASTVSEATEGVSKFMLITHLGFEKKLQEPSVLENDKEDQHPEKLQEPKPKSVLGDFIVQKNEKLGKVPNKTASTHIIQIDNVHPRTVVTDFINLFKVAVKSHRGPILGTCFFLEFETRRQAECVYSTYNGMDLNEQPMKMKYVTSMPDKEVDDLPESNIIKIFNGCPTMNVADFIRLFEKVGVTILSYANPKPYYYFELRTKQDVFRIINDYDGMRAYGSSRLLDIVHTGEYPAGHTVYDVLKCKYPAGHTVYDVLKLGKYVARIGQDEKESEESANEEDTD